MSFKTKLLKCVTLAVVALTIAASLFTGTVSAVTGATGAVVTAGTTFTRGQDVDFNVDLANLNLLDSTGFKSATIDVKIPSIYFEVTPFVTNSSPNVYTYNNGTWSRGPLLTDTSKYTYTSFTAYVGNEYTDIMFTVTASSGNLIPTGNIRLITVPVRVKANAPTNNLPYGAFAWVDGATLIGSNNTSYGDMDNAIANVTATFTITNGPLSSTLTPATASFDKYTPANATTSIALNGNTLSDITLNGTSIGQTNYTFDSIANTVTIKKEYLSTLGLGDQTFTFDMNAGTDPTFKVTISDTTPVVNAAAPTIDTQPADLTVYAEEPAHLQVAATISDAGALSYQWYSNTSNSNSGGTLINGATNAAFDAPSTVVGATYYYAEVTNTNSLVNGSQTAHTTSRAAKVTVNIPNPPSSPQNLTAGYGNREVLLNWGTVTGATYYQVYMTTVSGQYGAEPSATVTNAAYTVQGLNNGTPYYFIVKAGNLGGISAGSNEAGATPVTVPSIPTNVSAVAGIGQAFVSFTAPDDNGGTPITGYEVTSSPGDVTVTGTASPVTVTGLMPLTSYTFTVKAINGEGKSPASASTEAVITRLSSSSSSSSGTSPSAGTASTDTTSQGAEILVNGKMESAGQVSTETINGQSVTTVVIDQTKLESTLAAEGMDAVVTIPVKSNSNVVIGELNGEAVKSMEASQAVLEIKTDSATYKIPAQQFNIDALRNQIGNSIALQDLKIQIEIAQPSADTVKRVETAASQGAFTLVVPPINFTVTGTYGDQKVEITQFNAYVERTITLPEDIDPSKITTGVVVDPDGTTRHVPTKVVFKDGKYVAVINSLTNSTYSVVYHPLTFGDTADHWAKAAISDMGSRMVIDGTGNGLFSPEKHITRAEFAAMMVRGLGLKLENGTSSFSDVKAGDWYSGVIHTAYTNHLISGFEDGSFRPGESITREQAMVIIAKAMNITGLKSKLPAKTQQLSLSPYEDALSAAEWAQAGIADSLEAGIVGGRSDKQLAPKALVTRAEVAAMVQRLLQKSDLIQ
ncbi:S-layer homology domain-containing protein [Paenibacillus thalictri]|nr:S-layer homology domain-containing protein [Paenibacillus thalictri]